MSSHQIAMPAGEEERFRALRELLLRGKADIVGANNRREAIPAPLQEVLVRILAHMQEGQAITLVPASHELGTQDSADLLGVSRQYMVRLLEDGKLPFHRAGTHRRVYLRDLLAYKAERNRRRREAIDQIARQEVKDGTYDVFVLPEE